LHSIIFSKLTRTLQMDISNLLMPKSDHSWKIGFQKYVKILGGVEFINNPPAFLQNLRDKGKIDHNEEGMFKNFWKHIQDEGPHQGLTSESEALYRLHMATAITRYLKEKLMSVT